MLICKQISARPRTWCGEEAKIYQPVRHILTQKSWRGANQSLGLAHKATALQLE